MRMSPERNARERVPVSSRPDTVIRLVEAWARECLNSATGLAVRTSVGTRRPFQMYETET